MSSGGNDGSDFSDHGEYLQETPSTKRLKLSNIEGNESIDDSPTQILSLHTDWVQREAGDRATAYVGSETEGPIPVPQSDFEIEINSTGQDGNNSPGQEISLSSSAAITIPIEPRILTIDSRLTSDHSSSIRPASPNATITTTVVTDMSTEPIQSTLSAGSPVSIVPTSIATQPTDFTSLIRPGMIQVTDQQTLISHSDLPGGQFIQATGDGASPGGPLYVMIPPTTNSAELLQAMQHGQRPIMPRLSSGAIVSPASDDGKKHKDIMRKQTHNEVERRRRDRINELIKILAEVVPGCQKKDSSNGSIVGYVYSKGTVLEKTVEYVRELILQNEQLASTAKLAEKSANAIQLLQNQITVLEKENTFLRAQMVQLGIDNTSNPLSGARSLLTSPLAQSLLNSQIAPPPPPPPAPPTPSVPNPNTSQLLVSLAQTLTSNPLLASLSQSSPPSLPNNNNNTSVSTVTNETQVTSQPQGLIPNSQANLLMNSLVQTLASIANTNSAVPPPPAPPPPPTQVSGLSTSAAVSLLNSLLMAQNALTSTTTNTTTSAVPLSSNAPSNLLVSPHTQDKAVSPQPPPM